MKKNLFILIACLASGLSSLGQSAGQTEKSSIWDKPFDSGFFYYPISGTDEVRVISPYIYYPPFTATWAYNDKMYISEEIDVDGKMYKVTSLGGHVMSALYIVPDEVISLPASIRTLEPNATKEMNHILVLNEGLISIMANNFFQCYNTAPITLPSTVKYIGDNCFNKVDATAITLNEGLSFIGKNSFCNLDNIEEIRLPESLKIIGEGSFCNLERLKRINIPRGLKDFDRIIQNCPSLERVEFAYRSLSDIPRSRLDNTNFGIHILENCTFVVPSGTAEMYREHIIPNAKNIIEKTEDNGSVNPNSIAGFVVEDDNFYYSLIDGTDEVRVVHPQIFFDKNIRWSYKDGMRIKDEIEVDGKKYKVTAIGKSIGDLFDTGDERIEIPSSIRKIEPEAAYDSGELFNTVFNEGLVEVMSHNFKNLDTSNPMSISFPSTLRYIGSDCFTNIDVTDITFNEGLTYIGSNSFCDLGVEELVLPESLTIVEQGSFCNLHNLKRLYIPKGLVCLSAGLFMNCPSLERVELSYTSGADISPLNHIFDRYILKNCTFVVPDGTKELYKDYLLRGAEHIVEKSEESSAVDVIIESISNSSDYSAPRYYNLSGIEISEEEATSQKGIVIRKSNGKSEKLIIR